MKTLRVWTVLLLAMVSSVHALEYFVDGVHGDDAWPGAKDSPFRTLERALKQYRVLNRAGALRGQKLQIVVNPAIYVLSDSLMLEAEDSVPDGAVVEWLAKPGVVLTSAVAVPVSSFVPVADEAILSRLPEEVRSHVVELDLRKAGVTVNTSRPKRFRSLGWTGMLLADGVALQPASWPDGGKMHPMEGAVLERGGKGKRARYRFDEQERFAAWKLDDGIWLHGFFCHGWYDECMRMAAVDSAKKEVEFFAEESPYGLVENGKKSSGGSYQACNVLEELDRQGEWWVSADGTKLVAWLPNQINKVSYSAFLKPLLCLRNCRGHRFHGFAFAESAGGGVAIEGNDNWLTQCRFQKLGGQAISIRGYRNKMQACEINDIGEGGISVMGGDMKTLTAAMNEVTGCHVQRVGFAVRTWTPAVKLSGVGNLLRDSKIENIRHNAVSYDGCEHLIEHNEFANICRETADGGTLYTSRHWESRGNVIRHNYFHDSRAGICLDDCDSGDTICFNLFVKVPQAVFIGGGRDNVVQNNVFISSEPAVCMDDRGVTRLSQTPGNPWNLAEKLEAVNYRQAPWNQKYPELETMLTDHPELPLHNVLERNVFVTCGLAMKPELRGLLTEADNLYMQNGEELGIDASGACPPKTWKLIRERLPAFQPLKVPRLASKP